MGVVNSRTAWLSYSLIRIALFAVPFGVLYAIGWTWWLALITATLISVAVSILVLDKQRSRASESIHTWRNRAHTEDDIAEDAVLDDAYGTRVDGESADPAHGPKL